MLKAFFGREDVPLLLVAAMLMVTALSGWRLVAAVREMAGNARAQAISERDAHWTGEIARNEALTGRRIAEQARSALAIEADANARLREAQEKLSELEKQNAALPNGDACGLDRERVRLLAR